MAAFDAFAIAARAPRRLWLLNGLVHGVLALALLHALSIGLRPTAALGCALVLALLHAALEHRRIATSPRRLRVQEDAVFLDDDGEHPWHLRRVSCAARGVMLAQLEDGSRQRRWLCMGADQLDEPEVRRLLRWLRAGVPDRRVHAPVGIQR